MGAVGGLLVRQLETELAQARTELARLKKAAPPADEPRDVPVKAVAPPEVAPIVVISPPAASPFVKQPAIWFAVTGWAVAVVLLFRRRSI